MWLFSVGFAVAYSALNYGGSGIDTWNTSLLALGIGGLLWLVTERARNLPNDISTIAVVALAFPAYVAFQLVPIPVGALEVLSPARAEVTQALARIGELRTFAPLAINPPETAIYLSRSIGLVLVFLPVASGARRARHPWLLTVPLLLVGGVEAVWGISQFYSGKAVVSGTYANRNHFSNLLAMVLPFAAIGGLAMSRRRSRQGNVGTLVLPTVGFSLLAAALLAGIVLTSSRMGFLSAMGSLLVVSILLLPRGMSLGGRFATGGMLIAAGMFALVFLPSDSFVREFVAIPTDGRGPIWKDSLSVVYAYPVFGVGFHAYYSGLLRYQTSGLANAWTAAHNDYLQLLAELGVIGFAILVVLVAAVVVATLRTARVGARDDARLLAVACAGSMTALLLHSAADFNLYISANALMFAWVLGLAWGVASHESGKQQRSPAGSPFAKAGILALSSVSVLYAGGWLVYLHMYRGNARVESTLCRLGICDGDRVALALQQARGVTSRSLLPPAELVTFLTRDPANPHRWLELGESLHNVGRSAEADSALARAVELGPRLPFVLSSVGKILFSRGESSEALALTKTAIQGDPSRLHVFSQPYWSEGFAVDLNDALRNGVPDDPIILRTLLRQRMSQGTSAHAEAVWNRLLERSYVDGETAGSYVEYLARQDSVARAWTAWTEYSESAGRGATLVSNGDFETDFVSTRFDWQTSRVDGAVVDFDREIAYSGDRSLRLVFEGRTNPSDLGVRQVLYLEGGRYRVQARIRALDVTTDEGVAIAVASVGAVKFHGVATEAVRGRTDWRPVEQEFEVPAGGAFVRVSVVRQRSFRLNNLLGGTAWIDAVRITPVPAV